MATPVRKSRGETVDFGLLAANQRLRPEERLDAFLTHSRLMMELYKAGQAARRAVLTVGKPALSKKLLG